MKTILPYFCLFFFYFFSQNTLFAQQEKSVFKEMRSNYFKIEFSGIGASMNLSGNSSNANANLLDQKADIGIAMTLVRFTHLFSKDIGWYAGVNMNLFKEKRSPYYDRPFSETIGDFAMHLFYGGFKPSPIIDAGLVYRLESRKWDFNPRIGLGYGLLLLDRDSDKTKILDNGVVERSVYKQRSASTLLSIGFGTHYYISKRSFIALNAGLQQPLSKSYGELVLFKDNQQVDYKKYNSTAIGRDLNLTVGYGFILGNRTVSN